MCDASCTPCVLSKLVTAVGLVWFQCHYKYVPVHYWWSTIIAVSLNLQFWVYEGLNDPITIPELLMALNTLKQGTAAGNDSLLNEYFVETIDILCSHVCDILNSIINTVCFPETWMEGVIIQIYIKGDTNEASNYRVITYELLSEIVHVNYEQKVRNSVWW